MEVSLELQKLRIREGLDIVVVENDAAFVSFAADQVCGVIKDKPDAVLGLATGSTPIGLYAELVKRYQATEVDFSQIRTFNLDEYVGLAGDHPQSYRQYMHQHLFSKVNLQAGNTYLPSGIATDLEAEAARYDALLERLGPVDLQILGIGENAHIAFNEPGTPFSSSTHVVDLTESTIEANARFFASRDEVPRQAVTMGIASILRARRVMLLAQGDKKAEAIRLSLEEEMTPQVPASALQSHPSVLVVVDRPAASRLAAVR
jgi:glucosamine-6-phosphate deaminase